MKKRNVLRLAAVIAALYAAKTAIRYSQEVRRYNHILSLSNEGTVSEELPELMLQVLRREKQTLKEWMRFMTSFPKDLARYLKIESM